MVLLMTALLGLIAVTAAVPVAAAGAMVERGRLVYEQACAVCHGVAGDGRGMSAHMFVTQPRDFRQGIYKFRSTPTGSLPLDRDLFLTLSRGVRGTAMVSQIHLSDADRWAVVQYLKTFSPRFRHEASLTPIPIPDPRPRSPALIQEGRTLYVEAGCGGCHGASGRGDGPKAGGLRDEWGWPIRPTDLTRRPLKGGSTPLDLYRTLAAGVGGTPMPSYLDSLEPNQIWALVVYLRSLPSPVEEAREEAIAGEEARGYMVERMARMMGPGMMGRMPMMRGMGPMGGFPGWR
jgi:cytochrome c oxidase cbb3-type subunit I/II